MWPSPRTQTLLTWHKRVRERLNEDKPGHITALTLPFWLYLMSQISQSFEGALRELVDELKFKKNRYHFDHFMKPVSQFPSAKDSKILHPWNALTVQFLYRSFSVWQTHFFPFCSVFFILYLTSSFSLVWAKSDFYWLNFWKKIAADFKNMLH